MKSTLWESQAVTVLKCPLKLAMWLAIFAQKSLLSLSLLSISLWCKQFGFSSSRLMLLHLLYLKELDWVCDNLRICSKFRNCCGIELSDGGWCYWDRWGSQWFICGTGFWLMSLIFFFFFLVTWIWLGFAIYVCVYIYLCSPCVKILMLPRFSNIWLFF